MEINKKSTYLWVAIALANIAIALVVAEDVGGGDLGSVLMILTIVGTFILVTVVPVMVSRSLSRWKNYFGYGIPALLLLPIVPYWLYETSTCVGEYCGLGALIVGFVLGLPAIVFVFFYIISAYYHKLSSKFALPLLLAIPAFLIGLLWLFGGFE